MSCFQKTLIASVAAIGFSGAASAAVLTFDSVADCSGPDVTITGGAGAQACEVSGAPGGSSALVRSTSPGDSFWTATFASLTNSVSIDLGDYNADADRLFLRAYDSLDALLSEVTLDIDAADATMHTLSVALAGIAKVTFGITADLGTGSGIYADNLTFTTGSTPGQVPVPAAGLLLVGALGGLAGLRRRRRA